MNMGNRVAVLSGLIAVLTVAAACEASLYGSDDFDDDTKDPARWGTDQQDSGDVFFMETNGRLELHGSSGVGQYLWVERPWVLSAADYGEDWSATIDVNMVQPSINGDDDLVGLGLGVYNPNDSRDYADFVLSWSVETGLPRFYGRVVTNSQLTEHVPTAIYTWNAALQFSWDASGTTLSFLCDPNGSVGGYTWTSCADVNLAAGNDNWGMSAGNTFDLAVTGQVGGGAGIGGSEANADNFQTIPEPSTAVLLSLSCAAGGGLGRRRRRPTQWQ